MNNKGFAITTVLYGILILFCLLLVSLLGILSTYQSNLKKLEDENNGAKAIINNNSINKYTFTLVGSAGGAFDALGPGIHTLTKSDSAQWAGYCLSPALFSKGKNYRLLYSIQKTEGTLLNIGGHSSAAKEVSFYIDNVLQDKNVIQYNVYHEVGPVSEDATSYVTETNLDNDTNTHNVEVSFLYDNTGVDGRICVQPNRGLKKAVSVKISNLRLIEVS